MSMTGKLRQVSEFDLAKYKKNPGEMVRALAGALQPGVPAGFATLRETLQQSPVVQKNDGTQQSTKDVVTRATSRNAAGNDEADEGGRADAEGRAGEGSRGGTAVNRKRRERGT
jgi:hypothetical protein